MEIEEKTVSEEISDIEEKFFWGNPRIEIKEGFFTHKIHKFQIKNKKENQYDENDLEIVKQYIWELNKNNKLIQSSELLCTNVPNKISISEYLNIIGIYLSYIESIKVLKSCVPNNYYVHLKFKNVEYANVFYNTFNYSRLNFIEKEFLVYSEILRMDDRINEEKADSNLNLDELKLKDNIKNHNSNSTKINLLDGADKTVNELETTHSENKEEFASAEKTGTKIKSGGENSNNEDLYQVKRARSKKYRHKINFDVTISENFEECEAHKASPKNNYYYINRGKKSKNNQEELEEINTNINTFKEPKIRKISNNYEYIKLKSQTKLNIPNLSSKLKEKENSNSKNTQRLKDEKDEEEAEQEQQNYFDSNNSNIYDIKVCPICLEYLDSNRPEKTAFNGINKLNEYNKVYSMNALSNNSGFITMLCGHTFHIECSLKFEDEKCPICRYYISPISTSTCSLCTNEDDLWLCLICGSINCAAEGNEHRKQHYFDTGHVYAKKLGDSANVTFDLSRNINLNSWFQHSIYNNFSSSNAISQFDNANERGQSDKNNKNNNTISSSISENLQTITDPIDVKEKEQNKIIISENNNTSNNNGNNNNKIRNENDLINLNNLNNENHLGSESHSRAVAIPYSKNSKDKLDFIITEYNSIISSQLESQRFFYLNRIKLLEEKYTKKITEMDKEIDFYQSELDIQHSHSEEIKKEKTDLLNELKENESVMKSRLLDYSGFEKDYDCLLHRKNSLLDKQQNKGKFIKEEIRKLEDEIANIKHEIKDLKVHIDVKKNKKISEISGASFRAVEFKSKK